MPVVDAILNPVEQVFNTNHQQLLVKNGTITFQVTYPKPI